MDDYRFEQVKENIHIPARVELVECPPTIFPSHWHEHIEILYLIDGMLTVIIQGQSYDLVPGAMAVIHSRELHMTRTQGTTAYLLLQISADQMNRFFTDFDSLHFQTILTPQEHDPQTIPLFHSLLEMITVLQNQEDGYQLLFTSKLYEFLYHLYKGYSKWEHRPDPASRNLDFQRVTQIMNWVKKNCRQPLTLDDAASSLGISREYFCRLFKKCTGQTFLEYVSSVRAMQFHQDLLQTEDHITFLMEKNGITNYKVFMRTFKRLYGTTPQQLRKTACSIDTSDS